MTDASVSLDSTNPSPNSLHIRPRKHGGTDHPSNLQALCWRCNSMKGARDVNDLAFSMKRRIEARDPSVRGFNLGANAGTAAGQTVMHLHVHLIGRRPGDMEDPRGGVRHVIPGKGKY